MADIFISHVEEEARLALALAQELEHRGLRAWYYERDTVPGQSYLLQIGEAIDRCRAVILLISSHALGSHQVRQEVIRAFESNKPFLPLLIDVSHAEFQTRQPEWRAALGATTSVRTPPEGIQPILPQLTQGLAALGIHAGDPPATPARSTWGSRPEAGRPSAPPQEATVAPSDENRHAARGDAPPPQDTAGAHTGAQPARRVKALPTLGWLTLLMLVVGGASYGVLALFPHATTPPQQERGQRTPLQHETQPLPTRAPASESALKLTAILAEGHAPLTSDLLYRVYEVAENPEGQRKQVAVSADAAPLFKVPVGRYYVTVEHGRASASTAVEVTAAQVVQQTLNLNAGYLRLFSILAPGMAPLTSDLLYRVYEVAENPEGQRKQVAVSADAAPLFKVPVGRYYVTVEHGRTSASTAVEVTAAQVVQQTLNLNAGYLRLFSILAPGMAPLTSDLLYRVYEVAENPEGQRKQVAVSADAAPLFKVPVGRYYVTVEHGRASASTAVEVTAAQVVQQTLNLNAGYLRLFSILAPGMAPLTSDLLYRVYEVAENPEGQRKQVAVSADAAPLFKVPVGRYYVTVDYRGAHARKEVEIAAGQVHEMKLEMKMP